MDNFNEIIKLLLIYKNSNPNLRFGQILFNLGVNKFNNQIEPEKDNYLLKDIYNDTDSEILNRMLTFLLNKENGKID